MSEVAVEQKVQKLETRVEELEQRLKEQQGGKQPDKHIKVWGESGAPTPGSPEIGKLIGKIKSRQRGQGMTTNQVQEFLGLNSRSRVIDIMRELGNHPDLKYRGGAGSSPSKIMVPSK